MSKKLPNIILLVLDTVGAKHLSLYNYHRPTTPNLERIARDCTVYTRCFAPACWTVPSHASMFTGLYPSQHGAFENGYLLRDNLPHLVPTLQASGYRTLGISTNSLVSPASGLCRGFDEFHDLGSQDLSRILAGLEGHVPEKDSDPGTLSIRLRSAVSAKSATSTLLRYLWETGRVGEVLQKTWKMITKQAAKWLRPGPIDNATPFTKKTLTLIRHMFQRHQSDDSPFFLFVNILQAHQNYCPPWRWRRFSRWRDRAAASPQKFYFQPDSPALARLVATYQNLYDDELRYLDAVIGSLWPLLDSAALLDDTLVIITSDHGEHFGERGHYTHILSLYNELIWVPLIMRVPRHLARPGLDPRLASLTDLYATILDVVDSPLPRPETSFSLLAPPRRELVLAQCVHPEMWQTYLASKQALSPSQGETFSPPVFAVVTDGGTKIIEKRDGGLEVYDLKEGMVETRDLAPTLSPEVLGNYRSLLDHLKTETGFHEATASMRVSADQRAA
ncbi:MAG: sulfatase [Syntrophobacterales bacterium]